MTRFPCSLCPHSALDPDAAMGHLMASHVNRRIAATEPNPGRRRDDVREIGTHSFRDRQTFGPGMDPDVLLSDVPRGSDYSVMSPSVRRFLQAADNGEGLHRGRKLA